MDLKRRGLEMGGLLLVLLLRSCLLSAVDGTLTFFCSQHGSLGNEGCGAAGARGDKNLVVNAPCSGRACALHSPLMFPAPRPARTLAAVPCLKVEVFYVPRVQQHSSCSESLETLQRGERNGGGRSRCG